MDLVAIFSNSPKEFKERFIINPNLELGFALDNIIAASTKLNLTSTSTQPLTAKKLKSLQEHKEVPFDESDYKNLERMPLKACLIKFNKADIFIKLSKRPPLPDSSLSKP